MNENAAAILAAAKDIVNAGHGVDVLCGDAKVFISRLVAVFAGQVSEAEFKAILVDAWKSGDLVLVRADLVEAFEPAEVAASEVTRFGARAHLLKFKL